MIICKKEITDNLSVDYRLFQQFILLRGITNGFSKNSKKYWYIIIITVMVSILSVIVTYIIARYQIL